MRSSRRATGITLLAMALAMSALAACGGASTPSGSSWTPAPKVTVSPRSVHWAVPTRLRGKLLPGTWTTTASFTLPAGPATVVGILKVPGSTAPSFSARVLPVPRPASVAGYSLTGAALWNMPMIRQGEGAIAGWFPFALPAGTYRLLVRETSGDGSGGSYDLNVAGAAGTASASSASGGAPTAASVASPRPALSSWSPERLRAALPGLLVTRFRHPRLEIVSPDATRTIVLWTPPAGYGVGLLDCDPSRGRALLRVWDRRAGPDEGSLVLLAEDGTARRLDLPGTQRLEYAVMLADGSLLCSVAQGEYPHPTRLLWSDGSGDWQPVRITGNLLNTAQHNAIVGLEPMAGRRAVLLKTWAWGGAMLPAKWDAGTLTASGAPVRTDWLSGAPLPSTDSVLMARAHARDERLAVDLVQVRWLDGAVQKRVIVADGPQSSGHDAITLVGAGPRGSALLLGWRLDGGSAPTEKDDARAHHLQRLDLATGRLAVLPLEVSSDDGWLWLQQ